MSVLHCGRGHQHSIRSYRCPARAEGTKKFRYLKASITGLFLLLIDQA
jgi:hypothetical protein